MSTIKKKIFVHRNALVESHSIGSGTRIWTFSHIQKSVRIGRDCNIGEHCFIEEGVVIGNRVTIKNGVCIWKGMVIADDVFIGPNATFTNDLRPRSPRSLVVRKKYASQDWIQPVLLGEGCTVGANSTIIGPVLLSSHCFIGAGSVVTRSIDHFELVVGNPARRIGWVNLLGERVSRQPRIQ